MSVASQCDADLVRAAYYAGYRDAARHARNRALSALSDSSTEEMKRIAADVAELAACSPPYPPPVDQLKVWIDEHPETPAERRFREET